MFTSKGMVRQILHAEGLCRFDIRGSQILHAEGLCRFDIRGSQILHAEGLCRFDIRGSQIFPISRRQKNIQCARRRKFQTEDSQFCTDL